MLAVFAKCIVQKGQEGEFLKLAHALAEKSREDAQNVSYDVLTDPQGTDNAYYFLEKWQDKAGLDLHMQQQYFVDTIAAVGKISEGDLEIHLYETV